MWGFLWGGVGVLLGWIVLVGVVWDWYCCVGVGVGVCVYVYVLVLLFCYCYCWIRIRLLLVLFYYWLCLLFNLIFHIKPNLHSFLPNNLNIILGQKINQQLFCLTPLRILNNSYFNYNTINHLYMIVSLINSMLDTDIKIFRIDNSVGFPKLDEYGFSLFLF